MSAHEKCPDELTSLTKDLAEVVDELCKQIKLLKEERSDTDGQLKDAYNLVIKNKVWILQTLINAYSDQTKKLELDKEIVTIPELGGPTGCTVEVVDTHGANGTTEQ
jgi:hypothetical protein